MRPARTAIPTGRCVSTSRLIRVPWSALGRCGILAGSRNGRHRPDHAVLAGAALPAHVVSRPCDPGCDRDMPARVSLACLRGAPPVNRCLADIVPLSHVVRLAPRRCAVSDDNSRLKRGRAEAALRRREALPQGTLRSIWTRKSACFLERIHQVAIRDYGWSTVQPGAAMTVKEIEGRCWFPRIGLLLLSHNIPSGKW